MLFRSIQVIDCARTFTLQDSQPCRLLPFLLANDTGAEESSAPSSPPSQRIDLRVSSVEVVSDTEDIQQPVDGGVRLTIRWAQPPDQPLRCGEHIRATARLLPPRNLS